jgi:FkbM family methyltransferase
MCLPNMGSSILESTVLTHTASQAPAPTRRSIVAHLKDVLRPLEPWLPARESSLSWRRAVQALRHHGFEPKTVFDVGVGFGTWGLYRAFPDAFYHLVDPTPESLPYMHKLAKRLSADVHALALGDRDGEARLEIRADIQGSTLLEEVGPRDFLRFESVPMRRFDRLFTTFPRPALCKIDVQGAELMVLEGMTERLAEIDALIVETSTIATVKGGAEVAAVVEFLGDHGFVVADIIGLKRRPLDGATAQVDLLFVPETAALRADRRWASA